MVSPHTAPPRPLNGSNPTSTTTSLDRWLRPQRSTPRPDSATDDPQVGVRDSISHTHLSEPTMDEALTLTGVSKQYGPTRALSDVGLSVAPGEVHALMGENGAGKSTLLKILSGAVAPDSGQ